MQPIFAASLKAGLGLTIATAVLVEPAFSLGQLLRVSGGQTTAQTLAQTTTLTDLQSLS